MTACSDQSVDQQPEGEIQNFEFAVDFGEVIKTRAQSDKIPNTSWTESIKNMQIFLYEGTTVKYSYVFDQAAITSAAAGTQPLSKLFVRTDVPTTTTPSGYTLVVTANVNSGSDPIETYISNAATIWNSNNVRKKLISDLAIGYKPTTETTATKLPTYVKLPAASNRKGVQAPSEVFMGYATGITLGSGETKTASVALKREVSMLRARLNIEPANGDTDNVNSVDWDQDISILIYTLPENMKLMEGTTGGVAAAAIDDEKIILAATTWNTTEPTTATHSAGTKPIISNDFNRWKDIVVFPNNGGRGSTKVVANGTKAETAQQYYIVVTAKGKIGHKLANGSTLTVAETIWWDGLIQEAFFPNHIREVNLSLKSGGNSGEIPDVPKTVGELDITVSSPAPWDTNIIESNIEM